MSELDSIVSEFLVESYENLDQLDQHLVELEKTPTEKSLLSSIFRTIHTIKGTCGFLGFSKLESVAHVGETLLSRMREGELLLNAEITSGLLAMVDAVRQILAHIESGIGEGNEDYSSLVETLTRLSRGEFNASVAPAPAVKENKAVAVVAPAAVEIAPAAPAPQTAVVAQEPSAPVPAVEGKGLADTTIRVDVSLLDTLMNLVGELVLARNQILQFSPSERDSKFIATAQTLNLLTTELQEGVMKTRMQPIGNIWDKFPRVVRDLALSCGKKVRLEMVGRNTELDKTLIEAIKDPMTHIVRNAVDHGIETQEIRAKNGKNPEGTLTLRAYHEGGQVNIEITDDGAGIDPARIKAKALEKNLITPEQAARMSDREVVNLIFLPGFSTAAKVTNVSGRGVGMDVVKTNIEKIGGTVDIQGAPGKGTTLKVKIPLTLAIIPALILTCSGNRFAIPQVSLLELVRLDGENLKKIERIQGTPVYRLRGNILPLVYLRQTLKTGNPNLEGETVNIVILQADGRPFGLVVDGIHDTEEIVVKPMGKHLKGISVFAGATIMGDGKVSLILDVMGIAQQAHLIGAGSHRQLTDGEKKDATKEVVGEKSSLLIFKFGEDGRMAIPLASVARLEKFKHSEVEHSGNQIVVQYRGEIMSLLFVSKILNTGQPLNEDAELMETVVFSHKGRSVGVVVDKILDIVEENITVKRSAQRRGIVGSCVVQERVTDILNFEELLEMSDPEFCLETTV
jgi:two-component system chemotaxis sensor kinase CheA